jgi:probable HAF family extracellular repeat protein
MMGPLFSTESSTFELLPSLRDAVWAGAWDINDAGQVIGFSERPDGKRIGMLWHNGTYTELEGLPSCSSPGDGRINNRGQVLVYDFAGCKRMFLWENGRATEIRDEGMNLHVAMNLNDAGQVPGIIDRMADGIDYYGQPSRRERRFAVVWHNGSITELPGFPGMHHESAVAEAINNSGQVVGRSWGSVYEQGKGHIYYGGIVIWQQGTRTPPTVLPLLPELSPDALTIHINDAGQVVGSVRDKDNSNAFHVVLWENGTVRKLPTLPGAVRSFVNGINNAGQIVGDAMYADGTARAVIWENGTVKELTTPLGTASSWANGINDLGKIAGAAYESDEIFHPVVWTASGSGTVVPPPPPATSGPGATPTGSNVEVTPNDATTGEPAPVGLTFPSVTTAGTTTITSATLSDSIPVPPGFRVGESSTYYEIKTDASFTGKVTVCIKYTEANYDAEGQIRLLHYNTSTSGWEDITTNSTEANPNPNTTTNTVCGLTSSFSPFMVAERNAAPRLTGIMISSDPFAVGTAVQMSASFSDANLKDTHTAMINWGDGTSAAGVVTSGTVTGARGYTAAGVYTVTVTVKDTYQGTGTSKHEYVVVYDPNGGFVTGGGWIMSPAGAYAADASLAGKATFGFVSKYQKGATTPTGNTEFQFHAGNLNFRSTAYEWLVISGPKAQYKGTGTINGSGSYGFILTANDGQVSGGGGVDKFRIKITNRTTGQVVYDNQMGSNDDAGATTQLGGGSIVIHSK